MFKLKNKVTLDQKSLRKRINRQLVANFFTIDEFKELTKRQSYKVIKLIAKIEKVSLTKKEVKDIVEFIHSDFEVQNVEGTAKLWDFIVDHIADKQAMEIKNFEFQNQFELNNYRKDRFDLLRM